MRTQLIINKIAAICIRCNDWLRNNNPLTSWMSKPLVNTPLSIFMEYEDIIMNTHDAPPQSSTFMQGYQVQYHDQLIKDLTKVYAHCSRVITHVDRCKRISFFGLKDINCIGKMVARRKGKCFKGTILRPQTDDQYDHWFFSLAFEDAKGSLTILFPTLHANSELTIDRCVSVQTTLRFPTEEVQPLIEELAFSFIRFLREIPRRAMNPLRAVPPMNPQKALLFIINGVDQVQDLGIEYFMKNKHHITFEFLVGLSTQETVKFIDNATRLFVTDGLLSNNAVLAIKHRTRQLDERGFYELLETVEKDGLVFVTLCSEFHERFDTEGTFMRIYAKQQSKKPTRSSCL